MTFLSRRQFFSFAAAPALARVEVTSGWQPRLARDTGYRLSQSDDDFLEDLSRRIFQFFWEQSDPHTGLVLDRVRANGSQIPGRNLEAASTALTGFLLTAMCIASERRWMDPNEIRERVRACLRHLAHNQEHVRGWYYHFVNRKNGERIWGSELSTIDTAMLLAGVLAAQQYFEQDAEIFNLTSNIYHRTDFPWLFDEQTGLVHMGWTAEKGLLRAEWASYDEQAILYILGIGSPTNPIPVRSWYLFDRQPIEFCGYRYLGRGPLFTHQYSQAWLSLSHLRDGPPFDVDYFQNSVIATYALRALCLSFRGMYPSYSENLWGITASDSEIGYVIWGDPLSRRDVDGTVVPCAAGGSLMFAPEICLPTLRYMYDHFAENIYGRYGFVDAFNPQTFWVNPDVVGIDLGITLLKSCYVFKPESSDERGFDTAGHRAGSSDWRSACVAVFARMGLLSIGRSWSCTDNPSSPLGAWLLGELDPGPTEFSEESFMNQLERVAFLVGGMLLAFTAALIVREGPMQLGRTRRNKQHPPVEQLANQLKQAWAEHHTHA